MPAPASHTHPSLTQKAARTAARRMLLQRIVRRAGVALSIGVGVGASAILADRLIGPGIERSIWWFAIGGIGTAALAWSALGAWARRPREIDGAICADDRLELDDALSTGLELSRRTGERDVFAQLAIDDAEALAKEAPIARATPIRLDNWWAVWPALLTASVAITFVEPLDLLTDKRTKIEAAERVAETTSAEKALEEAEKALEEMASTGANNTEDLASPALPDDRRMEALTKLREQLASGTKSSDDVRAEAAGELSRAADTAAAEAQQASEAAESASKAMSGLKPEELGAADSPAKQLAQALQSADNEAAARAADGMSRSLSEMSPQQRREEANRLSTLAKQLEELAAAKRAESESPREGERELTRQGVSEQEAKSLADNADKQGVEDELKKRGFDEDTARRLAEKMATERTERQSRERAAEELRQTADAVNKARDEAQRPDTAPPSSGAPKSDPPGGDSKPPQPQVDPGKPTDPASQPKPGDSPKSPDGTPQQPAPQVPGQQPNITPQTPLDSNAPKGLQTGSDQQQGEKGKPVTPPAGQPPQSGSPSQPHQQSPQSDPSGQPKPGDTNTPGSKPQPSPSGQQTPQGGAGAPKPEAPKGPQPNNPGNTPNPQGEKPNAEQGSKPDETPGEQPGQGKQPQQSPPEGNQPGEKGNNEKSQGAGQQPKGSADSPQQSQQPGEGGKQPDSANQPSQQPGHAEKPGAQPSPSNQTSQQSHGNGPDGAGKQGLQSLKDRLRKMAQQPEGARKKMQDAQKLREQAERMMESMTPEQRRELERLARERAREGGPPGPGTEGTPLEGMKSAPVDFRANEKNEDPSKPPSEREVLAEINDPNAKIDPSAPIGKRAMQPSAQETLKSVQKAIEEKQLPARYRNVEKYFKRAAEQEGAKPAQDAKPAEPVKDAQEVKK